MEIFKEHRGRGKQIIMLAKTELVKTYKGALLGPLWALVKPLFTLFIYWFAFEIGIRGGKSVHEVPFFIFMLPGFAAWFFMQDAILQGARSIRKNKQYVIKMSFPVSTIMTFSTLSYLIIHFMLTAIMYIYLIIAGYTPSVYNLQFFYYCPMMYMFFTMLTWSTAPMSAFSKDFENLISSIMTGLFWLSGIIWDSTGIENDILRKIMYLNPINYFANGYRNAFIYNKWFWSNKAETFVFICEFIFIGLIGLYNYKRLRKRLPDVL